MGGFLVPVIKTKKREKVKDCYHISPKCTFLM